MHWQRTPNTMDKLLHTMDPYIVQSNTNPNTDTTILFEKIKNEFDKYQQLPSTNKYRQLGKKNRFRIYFPINTDSAIMNYYDAAITDCYDKINNKYVNDQLKQLFAAHNIKYKILAVHRKRGLIATHAEGFVVVLIHKNKSSNITYESY